MEKENIIPILLVDDHHIILEGYKNVLSKGDFKNFKLSMDTADNCDTAWEMLHTRAYQLVFLDINFPVREQSSFLSGEDLGVKIREKFPAIKIVVLTVLEDVFRINNLLLNIDPAGFLLKGETTSKELISCVEKVLVSPPYYGTKVTKLLRSEFNRKSLIDDIDRTILYQLSLGTKTKDIPAFVHLSLRAVENRKRKLKKMFGVSGKGNKALLEKAREGGYI